MISGQNKNIPVLNIFYMLSYAFSNLSLKAIEERIGKEDFNNIDDLFAEMLILGVSQQAKQGLHKAYIVQNESLPSFRGKLDLQGTIANRIQNKLELACEFDEWSEDNVFNQIIKSTLLLLKGKSDVDSQRKQRIKQLLLLFDNVQTIRLDTVKWNNLKFNRNSGLYPMLLYICFLVIDTKIINEKDGTTKMKGFWDDDQKMSRLYEKFLLGYFQKEHHYLDPKAPYVDWNIDESASDKEYIPTMQTDIMLNGEKRNGNERTLIIDAKYYGRTLTTRYDKKKLHTWNLYQIESYVFNHDKKKEGNVDGMLLYAQPEDPTQVLDGKMTFKQGNVIYFKTLDLNKEFEDIKKDLDNIAGICKKNP